MIELIASSDCTCNGWEIATFKRVCLQSQTSEGFWSISFFVLLYRHKEMLVFHQYLSSIKWLSTIILPLHWSLSFIKCLPRKVGFHQMLSSIKGCIQSIAFFYHKSSSIQGHLQSKVIFHQRLFSIKVHLPSNCLPSKFKHTSSIKGCLPLKDVFHQICLLSKVIFHQRLSSIKGHLPSKVVFHHLPLNYLP